MTNAITLQQFEQIDGLFNACLRRPDIDQVMSHPLASADYVRNVYYRPEWKLFDACVEVFGLDRVNQFSGAVECAAIILTDCLSGKIGIEDES